MSRPPSILIPSNFSNRTGFAWTGFFRVFRHIAGVFHAEGKGIVLSFAEVEGSVDTLGPDVVPSVLLFDPHHVTTAALRRLRRTVLEKDVRFVYWTDFLTWHWLFPLLRLWGVRKIVVHDHSSVASPHPAEPATGVRRLLKVTANRIPWLRADEVLTCSDFVKHRLVAQAGYPAARVRVIPYGLPDRRFRGDRGRAGDGPIRVFCASRATRVKGIHVLIEATRLLGKRTDLPDFTVQFAGDGPDLEAFRSAADAASLGSRFSFLGYVADTSELLFESDIVVIPSIWGDAFPYSVLESMAAGKAIVASRAGGIPEQLGEPATGLLVPPGDAEALADALARLLIDSDARGRFGRAALARAEREFREERYLSAVVDHLRRVFDGPNSQPPALM